MVARKGFAQANRDYLYPYPVYFRSPVTGISKSPLSFDRHSWRAMGLTTVIRDYGTEILNAIRENDLHKLKLILEKTLRSDLKIAKLCVTDIKHKPTKKFACPLILAARQEDPRIMRYMMEKGADPNFVHHTIFSSKRREIVTALHIAVDLGHYDTVEVLLNANADANIYDHNRETPLHIAVKKADHMMMRLLLSKGADPLIPDNKNNAALHTATLYGHLQMVRTLLKYDADIYQKGQWDVIAPHLAAKEGHTHLVQLFSANDLANINVKIPCYVDQREKAPIHLAAENGHSECLLVLLEEFDADVNLKDSDGNTALHCVVLHPYDVHRMRDKEYFTQSARTLLKFRVSVNEKNVFGDTALHFAAMNHYHKIVELLLQSGANPFLENEEGMKPVDTIPDSDTVTKQLLKMAMMKGRPSLSSLMPTQRHRGDVSMNDTTMQESTFGHSRSNVSYRSVSSTSSVFIDDSRQHRSRDHDERRAHRKPKSQIPEAEETLAKGGEQVQEQDPQQRLENEIAVYGKVNKKSKHRHGQASDADLGYDQQQWEVISTSTINEGSRHGGSLSHIGTSKGSQGKMPENLEQDSQQKPAAAGMGDIIRQQDFIEKKNRRNKSRRSSSGQEDISLDTSIPQPEQEPKWIKAAEKGEVIYENLPQIEADRAPPLPPRKNRPAAASDVQQRAELESTPVSEESGVKVHALSGHPAAIEVQCQGGPITISVDTKDTQEDVRMSEAKSPKLVKHKRHWTPSPKQPRKHSASPKPKRKHEQEVLQGKMYQEEYDLQAEQRSPGKKRSHGKQRNGSDSLASRSSQEYYVDYYQEKGSKKKKKPKMRPRVEQTSDSYANIEQNVEDYFGGSCNISDLESLQQSMMSESSQPELVKRIIEQKIAELLQNKVKKGQSSEDKMRQWLMESEEQGEETDEEEKEHIIDSDEWSDEEEFQTPSKWPEMEEHDTDNEEGQETAGEVGTKSTSVQQQQPRIHGTKTPEMTKGVQIESEEFPRTDKKIQGKGEPKKVKQSPKAPKLTMPSEQGTVDPEDTEIPDKSPQLMTFQEKLAWAKAQEKKQTELATPIKIGSDDQEREASPHGKIGKKASSKKKQRSEESQKGLGQDDPSNVAELSEKNRKHHDEYYCLTQETVESTASSATGNSVTANSAPVRSSSSTEEGQLFIEENEAMEVEEYAGSPLSQRKVRHAATNVGMETENVSSPRKRSKSQSDVHSADEEQRVMSPVTLKDIANKGIRTVSVMSEGTGLGLKVSGEVPKAYTHKDKSSARRAFMLASPVRIESSSECSDTELLGSRGSLSEVSSHKERGKLWEEPLMNPIYPKHSSGLINTTATHEREMSPQSDSDSTKKDHRIIGGYAKPYKTFGKIDVKTDLIEEAMMNASIPEDPETMSDLEPFEVSDFDEAKPDVYLTVENVEPKSQKKGSISKPKNLQLEELDKEPRGRRCDRWEALDDGVREKQEPPPLPLNSPPAIIKQEEQPLSPRSDTSSRSGRKVVSVKDRMRNEHGDIIETITTTVIKHEVPHAEVAVAEMVAPTDDLSFGDSTFDDLDELVMQNVQVKPPSELPPPPPELMKSDDSQELLNPLTDKTNKIDVDVQGTGEDEAVQVMKKVKKKSKSKKSTENLADVSSSETKKKKKKKKKVTPNQNDNKQAEEVLVVDRPEQEYTGLESYEQEPGVVKPKQVRGVATILAVGTNVPLEPSEMAKLQSTEELEKKHNVAANEVLADEDVEMVNYDVEPGKGSDRRGEGEYAEQKDNSFEEFVARPGAEVSQQMQERGRRTERTVAKNKAGSEQQAESNQSMTDIEVAQITDAAEARRKAREAARAQRLWHRKMIEEGKDPNIVLKSRSHSRETSGDRERNISPSPTRKKMRSPTNAITAESGREITVSSEISGSCQLQEQSRQGQEGSVVSLDSKQVKKKKAKKCTETTRQGVEGEKKRKKKKTGSADDLSSKGVGNEEDQVGEKKKKKKKKKTGSQSEVSSVGKGSVEDLAPKGIVQGSPPDTVMSDIWKEAMEGQPLASSETVYGEEQPMEASSAVRRSRRGRPKKDITEKRAKVVIETNIAETHEEEDEAYVVHKNMPGAIVEQMKTNKTGYEFSSDEEDIEEVEEANPSTKMTPTQRAEIAARKETRKQQRKLTKLGKKYQLADDGTTVIEPQEGEVIALDRSPKAGRQHYRKPNTQHAIQLQQTTNQHPEENLGEDPLPDSLVHRVEVSEIEMGVKSSYLTNSDEESPTEAAESNVQSLTMNLTEAQRANLIRAREAKKKQIEERAAMKPVENEEQFGAAEENEDTVLQYREEGQKTRRPHGIQFHQKIDDQVSDNDDDFGEEFVKRAAVPEMKYEETGVYETNLDDSSEWKTDMGQVPTAKMTDIQQAELRKVKEVKRLQESLDKIARKRQEKEQNLEPEQYEQNQPVKKGVSPEVECTTEEQVKYSKQKYAVSLTKGRDITNDDDDDSSLLEDMMKRVTIPAGSAAQKFEISEDGSGDDQEEVSDVVSISLSEEKKAAVAKAKEEKRQLREREKRERNKRHQQQEEPPEQQQPPIDSVGVVKGGRTEAAVEIGADATQRQFAFELSTPEQRKDLDVNLEEPLPEGMIRRAGVPVTPKLQSYETNLDDAEEFSQEGGVPVIGLSDSQKAALADARKVKRQKVQEALEEEQEKKLDLDEEGYLVPRHVQDVQAKTQKLHSAIKLKQPYQDEDEYLEITETMPDYEIRRVKAPSLPPRHSFETELDDKEKDGELSQDDGFKKAAFAALKEMQNTSGKREESEQGTAFTRSASGRVRVKKGARPSNLPQGKEIFVDAEPELMGEDALPPEGNTDAQLQAELAELQGTDHRLTPLMSELWQEKKEQESEMQLLLESVKDPAELYPVRGSDGSELSRVQGAGPLGTIPPAGQDRHLNKPGQQSPAATLPRVDRRPPPGPHAGHGESPYSTIDSTGRLRSHSEGRPYDPSQRAGSEGRSPRQMQPVKRRIRRAYPSDGELYSGHQSDSEAIKKSRRVKSISFYGDFCKGATHKRDKPPKMRASQSLEEVAWQQIRQDLEKQQPLRAHRVIKPKGSKGLNYTRGIYRPTPIYWRGSQRGFANTSRYDDSELIDQLWNERHRSMTTESEGDADMEDVSYDVNMPEEGGPDSQQLDSSQRASFPRYGQSVSDDEHTRLSQYSSAPQLPAEYLQSPQGQHYGAFQPIGPPKKVTIVEKKRKKAYKEQKDLPPCVVDQGPVDFKNYGAAAKLWMEQVEKADTQKFKTMYLSTMGNQQPPPDIIQSLPEGEQESSLGSQWVIARGRALRRVKQQYDQQRQLEGDDQDPESQDPGKQMLLFFKIGENWKDLAWVLFSGLQSDGDTLRMLKEIQHRHPDKVNDQVHDMMHRWWKKKGSGATVEELQRALEVLKMAYVEEEYIVSREAFSETEVELDVSTESEEDAEVNRLIHDYKTRSLNGSFENKNAQNAAIPLETPESSRVLSAENLLKKLEEATVEHIPTRINRSHITSPSPPPPSKPKYEDSHGESDYDSSADGTHRHSFVIIQPQLNSKEYKHETNM